jgi:NAD(P)H-nitrite reductase large subunit
MADKKAIDSGCHTVEAVNKAVGTGSGACKGHGCGPRIQEILDDFLSK